ncbi:MAG: hypothetical protein OHK93_001999 [Ramalina farinacea]|uniref:U1-type domain-containing protein n=1 Tax=Ramalina farinacea TaxID=258253 RepID=A0AA43QQL3_9LECA|nr:hypothetical protein [Ramalina farinacea]
MSEYWKSTPKYWCKHCKTYVRDTKLERSNHEATPRHQGNLQRFLRGLHRDHEREEREKSRAKQEVDRLNGVTSASPPAPEGRASAIPSSNASSTRQATPAERKAQLQQLAAMGVAVPEDFRREMAMAGEWSVQSQRIIESGGEIDEGIKKEEDEDDKKKVLNVGVRKRKHEGQEEEEEAGEKVVRKGWGSTTKAYPGAGGDNDLDALLNATRRPEELNEGGSTVKSESSRAPGTTTIEDNHDERPQENSGTFHTRVEELGKSAPSGRDDSEIKIENPDQAANPSLEDVPSGPVFKKRKSRPIKSK